MKRCWFLMLVIFYLPGCGTNHDNQSQSSQSGHSPIDSFFPVTSFIKGQIILLDSLPVTPLQITSVKEKTDSAWLQKSEFKLQIATFLTPEINETGLTRYFKQTKFNDQTLNAITFTYDPVETLPSSIQLRHWDVYIDPETGNVEKIYIVKNTREHDQSYTEQLTWQTGKFAKISSFLNKPDGEMELLKEVVFKWNF